MDARKLEKEHVVGVDESSSRRESIDATVLRPPTKETPYQHVLLVPQPSADPNDPLVSLAIPVICLLPRLTTR